MNLNQWNLYDLQSIVKLQNRKIICFGAGMVAQHMGVLFEKFDLLKAVLFWVDSNDKKVGAYISILGHKYEIKGKSVLYEDKYKDAVVIFSYENYEEAFEDLVKDESVVVEDFCTYLYANNDFISSVLKKEKERNIFYEGGIKKIPKIIHYCWFGGKELPIEQKRNIECWKKICPDYEIRRWDESNYDIKKNAYVREAYEQHCYAFVSDYVRLDVIYEYGGVYFDTDVELLHDLEKIRSNEAFFSYGKWPAINSGSGFGAIRRHGLIKEMRDNPRSKIHFYENGECNKTINSIYETEIMIKEGFKMDFTTQRIGNVILFSPALFPTATYIDTYNLDKNKCIAIHHDAGSWRK